MEEMSFKLFSLCFKCSICSCPINY